VNQRKTPRAGLFVGLALIGAAFGLVRLDRGGAVSKGISTILAPIQNVVTRAGQGVQSIWGEYVALIDVQDENQRLRAQLKELQSAAALNADLARENERLRRLLQLGDRRKDLRLRAARVVGRTSSDVFRVTRIELDVGDEPVSEGMTVIAPGGVVGQLRLVKGTRAEVLLITDPRSAIDVVLEQSQARAIAVGSGEADRYAANLKYLPQASTPVKGERVLTTGEDGQHPRGLVVGEVVEWGEPESGHFKKATLRPKVDLGSLEEVFIVLGPSGLTPDGARFEGRP
jgi:rod shape-determining protein MreC